MRPVSVTVNGVGVSDPIPLDYRQNPFSVGVGVDVAATATYTVQHTFDDPFAPGFNPATAVWHDHATLAALTAKDDGNYAFPVRAVRLNVTASTGDVTMTVVQAGF